MSSIKDEGNNLLNNESLSSMQGGNFHLKVGGAKKQWQCWLPYAGGCSNPLVNLKKNKVIILLTF